MSEFLRKVVLKRCPFCGGEAELVKTSKGYEPFDSTITDAFRVRCSHCSIGTESQKSDIRINEYGFVVVRANGAEKAILLWNKRTKFDMVVYQEERQEE